jgi:hypothetical protein
MTSFPVRIYDEVYSPKGNRIKNLFNHKKSTHNNEKDRSIFSNRMMTAGISRKVFNVKKKNKAK